MRLLLPLLIVISLSSCSALQAVLPALGGESGPTVNADLQVGGESTRQVVGSQVQTTVGRDQLNSTVKAEGPSQITVQTPTPWWILVALVLGWILPSPAEIWVRVVGIFKRR